MRSEQVHRLLVRENNRFELCKQVSYYLRMSHKRGARIGDSIDDVLAHLDSDASHHASEVREGLNRVSPLQQILDRSVSTHMPFGVEWRNDVGA